MDRLLDRVIKTVDDVNLKPLIEQLKNSGFEPQSQKDWMAGNWSGGCMRKKPLSCNDKGSQSRCMVWGRD
ncbi:hypothetical protein QJS10_CPB21g00856 [Acorus calamus]|uniref:Uncharacterized protein n=1 Tax=Acorus calamus TaxID=4465 RepID=A0AAV9C6K6_ACOCL|nr:hypothetical protein QJS10_CPB21g00856 [Acorus calamus]